MSQLNLETTQRVFEAFGVQDFDRAIEGLDAEVRIEFYGPAVIPYAGTWNGHDGARRFFRTVHESVDIHQFEPQELLPSGEDKVVVTGHLHLVAKSTGRHIDSDFVHVITFRRGLWLRFRDFMNTAVAAAAFS